MKKYLPLILVGVGVLIAVIAVVVVIGRSKTSNNSNSEDQAVPEIPASQRPSVYLIPSSDPTVSGSLGHFLDLKVQKINIPGAVSMDYELLYSLPDGRQQGVPGTVKLTGGDIERNLLLGSESSGKFRFDQGVETGSLTFRFRDGSGKLLGKLSTNFHLQSGTVNLSSTDGKFKFALDKTASGVFFVTMPIFNDVSGSSVVISSGGYAIFSSDGLPHTGKVAQ